jgi:hypothetical protein
MQMSADRGVERGFQPSRARTEVKNGERVGTKVVEKWWITRGSSEVELWNLALISVLDALG